MYAHRNYEEAIGEEVVSEIIAATDRGPSNHDYGVGGHEAFTSIVFAPKVWKPPKPLAIMRHRFFVVFFNVVFTRGILKSWLIPMCLENNWYKCTALKELCYGVCSSHYI